MTIIISRETLFVIFVMFMVLFWIGLVYLDTFGIEGIYFIKELILFDYETFSLDKALLEIR